MRCLSRFPLAIVLALVAAHAAWGETVMVPMRDGTKLATEVHLPATGGPKFPVVLVRTVYGRKSDGFYKGVTSRGMVAVLQDTRGYRDSQGEKMMFDADGWGAKQDGLDTVEWIKAQPWSNGRIGTWGVSALGITQNMLAPTTRDLSAQVIGLAPFDMFATFVRGGVPQKMLSERYAKMMGHEKAFLERRRHMTYDDYWEFGSPGARAGDITAPAVLVGGWFDLYPQGMIDNFVARQYLGGTGARGNQKLIVGPWEHGITETVGDLKFPDFKFDWTGYSWRFMEYWLAGKQNGIMNEPAVHYYVLGDCSDPQAPGNEWRTAASWPPFPTVATTYYLNQSGQLASQPSAAADEKRTFTFDPADPCPTLGGDAAYKSLPLDQQANSKRGDVLVFVTEPLATPVEVTGAVSVKLFVASDAPDTDFAARLIDYYPDGRQIVLASGIQRVKFRGGFEKPDPLPPGTVGELTIDCLSTSVVFNKGHRIGLHVSSSNWPRFEVNPNTGADLPKYTGQNEQGDWLIDKTSLRAAHNTVFMDATRTSALVLPVRPLDNDAKAFHFQPRGARVTSENKTAGGSGESRKRQRPGKPRIAPVPREAWNDAQKEFLEPLHQTGRLYNVFSTLANHPELYRDWTTFAGYILRKSTLSPRDREILILRIGWLCQAEYEWGQHVRMGRRAGLTDDDIRRISQGPAAADLTEHDRLLLEAADELHADACISDATWQALSKTYDMKQMMDIVFTVGEYNLVSMALNSFGVQLDEGLERFPK